MLSRASRGGSAGPVCVLVVICLVIASAPGATGSVAESPELVELYPNPVSHQDHGEYVVVDFPVETDLSGWALSDRYDVVALPNETVRGRIAFSPDPEPARDLTDAPVHGISGALTLANDGDRVSLTYDGVVVDETRYDRAPRSEVWTKVDGEWTWERMGATDFEPTISGEQRATAFALPDSPDVPVALLDEADDRILLSAYTLSSERVRRALIDAHERDVTVRVLVDGTPVGGMDADQAATLDALSEAGIEIDVLAGERARYAYQHAKYSLQCI